MIAAPHPLYCPRCQQPMRGFSHRGVALEHCRTCGGGLLSPAGLSALVREWSDPGSWEAAGVATRLRESDLCCPAHDTTPAMQVYRLAHGGEDLEVDICTTCASVWLDAGEGQQVEAIAAGLHAAQSAAAGPAHQALAEAQAADDVLIGQMVDRRHVAWPATLLMFGLFVAIMAYGYLVPMADYVAALAFVPVQLSRGERAFTVITSAFAHAHALHLVMNSVWFVAVGRRIEQYLGSLFVVALFVFSAIAGNLAFFALDPASSLQSVGASGGVAGFFGAMVVIAPKVSLATSVPQHTKLRWALAAWLLWQIAMALVGPAGVNYAAHVGGFVGGVVFAGVLHLLGLTAVTEVSEASLGPGRMASVASKMGDMIIAHPLISIPLTGIALMGVYALIIGLMAMDRGGEEPDPNDLEYQRPIFEFAVVDREKRRAVEHRVSGWEGSYWNRPSTSRFGTFHEYHLLIDQPPGFVLLVDRELERITASCIGQARGNSIALRVTPTALLTADDQRPILRTKYEEFRNDRSRTIFDEYAVTFEENLDTSGCPSGDYELYSAEASP